MEEEESLALPTLSPRLNWRRQEEEKKRGGKLKERGGGRREKKQEAEQIRVESYMGVLYIFERACCTKLPTITDTLTHLNFRHSTRSLQEYHHSQDSANTKDLKYGEVNALHT